MMFVDLVVKSLIEEDKIEEVEVPDHPILAFMGH